ncbi:Bile acyl-CoA synthetase [Cytospora mali]|uniref:Bile acyl-CoA synthetase n=1 Tax=Cytospora mali TaxID=578113 RepID=A0A194VS59_CYTMA|nr:Bile acyl-CoA synthetase [Valsa mali]
MSKKVRFDVVQAWSQDNDAAETHLNYFTCTLGEASRWNTDNPQSVHTVNDLIDAQAIELRQRPALNFAGGCQAEDGREMKSDFTYRELRAYSLVSAVRLRRRLQVASRVGTGTVGLLCSSSPEFILTWLGLMRLGVSVLLLAPQLQWTAIKHLCSTRKVSTIFTDSRNYDKIKCLIKDDLLAINLSHVLHSLKPDPAPASLPFNPRVEDIAHLFHTCSASSELPEPIPQSHHSAVSVLPSLPGGESRAIFSTTPLYHDGIADCLMAWTSGATIHLFPGTQPMTAANIHRAVDQANSYLAGVCPVKYFTCMPDILQMLIQKSSEPQTKTGLQMLQQMELVGVGGINLPLAIGDRLVANGVKLALRFSSKYCGFLFSSHRDYHADREWLYLRADPTLQPDYYDFEPQTPSTNEDIPPLFELVIKRKWPHRSTWNRADGSFATGDLFEKHPSIPNAWRYHSRADEQITLRNGERFHPAPVEGALLASEVGRRILEDTMMFGTRTELAGMLLFPMWSEDFVDDKQVIEEVWPAIERMNVILHKPARIGKEGLVVVRANPQIGERPRLPKNRKRTILRAQAESMFAREIESAYNGAPSVNGKRKTLPDNKAMDELSKRFDETVGRQMDTKSDLPVQGVNLAVFPQPSVHRLADCLP